MRASILGVCGSLVLTLALVVPAGAAGPAGTWKLNVAKSSYSPVPGPKSATIKIVAIDNGLTLTNDGIGADGKPTHVEYTAHYDGKDVAATVGALPNGADRVSFKMIDANTFEMIAKLKGKVLATSHIVYSADGKTRTNTVTGTTPDGKPLKNVIVYDKQ